jgi:hypothetical protein
MVGQVCQRDFGIIGVVGGSLETRENNNADDFAARFPRKYRVGTRIPLLYRQLGDFAELPTDAGSFMFFMGSGGGIEKSEKVGGKTLLMHF